MRTLLIVAMVAALLNCATLEGQELSRTDRVEMATQALLHALGAQPYKHPAGNAKRLCLGTRIGPGTPTDSSARNDLRLTRRRLARQTGLPVAEPEHCVYEDVSNAWLSQVVDRRTKQAAILLGVSAPRLTRDSAAEVRVASHLAGLWARGELCTFIRGAAGWKIKSCRVEWVS